MNHESDRPAVSCGQPPEVYQWVQRTRRGLLAYCATLPAHAFVLERNDFGWGSMRNTLVHVADCYRFWLAETASGRETARYQEAGSPDVAAVEALFAKTDAIVASFLAAHAGPRFAQPLSLSVRWQKEPLRVSPLWLVTHTITHEFHHKGQVVALGRLLGYAPPETDLAAPEG